MTLQQDGQLIELFQVALDEFVESGNTHETTPLIYAAALEVATGDDVRVLTPHFAPSVPPEAPGELLTHESSAQGRRIRIDHDGRSSTAFHYSLELDPEMTHPFRVRIHVAFANKSTSRLVPLDLRRFAETMSFISVYTLGAFATDLVEIGMMAFRARALPDAMRVIASACSAAGVLLWTFDFAEQQFHSIRGHGPVGHDYVVRLGGVRAPNGAVRGIVGLVRPGEEPIIYSIAQPTDRKPNLSDWEPHDPEVLHRNRWDACVAWPITADGELLGAISIYGASLRELRFGARVRTLCAGLVSEWLRDIELRGEFDRAEQAYEDEIAKNSYGRLATEFVHDYKTALETVEILLLNLDERALPTGMQRLYDQTTESIIYLKKVTSSLARLSKNVKVGTRSDLAEVLRDNSEFLKAMVERENSRAHLNINFPKQLDKARTCVVRMDELTALRTIMNLVHNAAVWTRGTKDATIDVRLEAAPLHERSADRERVRLTVSDNGPGVDPEIADRIFARGESSRKLDGGSGLGLYIVKKAAEAAGGSVTEVGSRREGAVFVLSLPIALSGEQR